MERMDRHDASDRSERDAAVRDHLANERTLLAWQRTALAVVALGFLVDRFALDTDGQSQVGSAIGAALVALGGVVAAGGAYRFVRTEREIETGTYRPALLAHLLLAGAIVLGAVAVAGYILLAPS
jgi:putative membrane protein